MKATIKGITFKNIELHTNPIMLEGFTYYSSICTCCLSKYPILVQTQRIDKQPSILGSCGVDGCSNDATYYIDFHTEDVNQTDINKDKIKKLVVEMLNDSHSSMLSKIDRVLSSGCIDLDGWDSNSYVLPKTIMASLLQRESHQYMGIGTGFEKQVKKQVKNISYFI